MGEVLTYLIEHNHPLDLLYEKYTIDQLWLFYEKSIIIKRKLQYEETVAFAHCMSLPLGGKEALKALNDFLKTLLPEDFRKAVYASERQEKIKKARPDKLLSTLGIPISQANKPGKIPVPKPKPPRHDD